MNLTSQRGTVLILALVYLWIVTLLSLISLQSSQLEIKIAQNEKIHAMLFYAAEKGLRMAEKSLIASSHCLYLAASMEEYAKKSNSWWHSAAPCHIEDIDANIFYVIEQLEEDACTRISKTSVARFYRITVYADSKNGSFPIKLQSAVAIGEKEHGKCSRKLLVTIDQGRQSWREIIS